MHERDILLAALELTRQEEREAYLAQACGEDVALRSRVDALLRAADVRDSFLERPAVETEVLAHETDAIRSKGGERADSRLDFLHPTDNPSALGRLGQYAITEVIGRGGMGVVLKGQDAKLNRVIAIKVLAPELASNPTARKRFVREAQAAAAVVHQHVVTIHAVDEDRLPFLVMEYIDGQSLQEKIDREGHLELKEILRIAQQVAAGLAAAHAHGLMHRDVKPANILLENGVGRVRITDFGLAHAVDDVGITRTGEVAGTPQYMSPEQAQGLPMDARSDLFSLGCVLYAMCTGRPPFRAETALATARRVCEDTPRPIREINLDIPDWLVAIIDRLLAKNPAERFQTAAEVADLLSQHLAHLQHPSAITPVAVTLRVTSPEAGKRLARSKGHITWSVMATKGWAIAATVLVCLTVSLGLAEATGVTHLSATVVRIFTPSGTLVVETDDPAVKITVEGDGGLVITGAGLHEVHLKPGSYKLQADKNGQPVPLERELVSITKGGREVVRVKLESPSVLANDSVWRGWRKDAPAPAVAPFDAAQANEHQQAWAKHLGVPVEYTNSIGMKFRLIPPGEFLMGSTTEEIAVALKEVHNRQWRDFVNSEAPQHRVILTKPIYLGVHEVTQEQYKAVMGKNPSHFAAGAGGDAKVAGTMNHSVESVNWLDAAEYCAKLSQKERLKPFYTRAGETITFLDGTGYRLPTEAEWEFACGAGTTSRYWSGDNEDDLSRGAWFNANSGHRTHAIGELAANPFGLFDVHGNVWEWVQDAWEPSYYRQFAGKPAIDPTGPPAVTAMRVIRGGDWNEPAAFCRSVDRAAFSPTYHDNRSGMRVVLSIPAMQGRGEAPKPEPQAFVLLGSTGVAERKFDTLAAAVLGASDTIEVRGNGPFVIESVTVNVPLVIRAGSGKRPVFTLASSATYGLATQAPLVLEGLELFCGDTDPKGGPATAAIVRVMNSQPLYVSHCRLVMMGSSRAVYGNPTRCEIRHCEFIRKTGVGNQAVCVSAGGPGQRLIVEGCAIAGSFLALDLPRGDRVPESGTFRFSQNTFVGGSLNQRANVDPQTVTAADFRLRPDSAGYRAGPDGKDLGADVDLVGPGPAYERWKTTPEYQQWLKETGQ